MMMDVLREAGGGSSSDLRPSYGKESACEWVLWVVWLNEAQKFQGLRKGGVQGAESYNPGEQGLKFRPQVPLLPVWNKHRAQASWYLRTLKDASQGVRVQCEGGRRLFGPLGKSAFGRWKFHAYGPSPYRLLLRFFFFTQCTIQAVS